MNRHLVLDTNAYSNLFRGDTAILDALGEAEEVCIPVPVLGELLAGFRMGNRETENRRELKEFLARPTVRVLPTTEEVADLYSLLVRDLKNAGTKIPTNDVWIAAHAMAVGGILLTSDAHFRCVPGLLVWDS